MAELELKKHIKKIVTVLKASNDGGWGKKVGSIATEIGIIVFSLMLANMLHNYSLKQHQEEENRLFLHGLKEDIKADIVSLNENLLFYQSADSAYSYLSHLPDRSTLDTARLSQSLSTLEISNSFRSHSSRYEGFKSSGKLLQIEDQQLLNDILLLYQEKIGDLKVSEGTWLNIHGKLINYLMEESNLTFDNPDYSTVYQIFKQRKIYNYSSGLIPWAQLLERYREVLTLEKQIVKRIDQCYPPE
ncbi:hypothetical protein [uncultured Acetobacteroides sp.]|uniref:hypothetical protein n=1 Tax=uncultured Acetobacteroides sp. TaxID=1760811 RepID=UPI0029F58696|nr:hypothetical protein [uncultured Acetobacteroides sp.]